MRTLLIAIAGLAGLAVVLWTLDRLLLAAEARGWIYYRHRKASPGTLASALMAAQANLEPGREHTVEILREEPSDHEDAGAPPPEDS